MNLHLLRIFHTVGEHASFSRAAEHLGISQPAVSKAVRELESQLETVLLDRRGKTFRPSESGRALYEYGRSILALEREATETIRAYSSLERGRLTVGASTTIATYWLPPFLVDFHARHPHVELQVISGNTRQIADLLFAKQQERGMTLVLVTHDPSLAARCTRQIRVASGQIAGDSRTEQARLASVSA